MSRGGVETTRGRDQFARHAHTHNHLASSIRVITGGLEDVIDGARCGTVVEERLRCIMHLVTRITIISTRSVVGDPPEEEERDTIHDHCSTLLQYVPDDTSAKSFEQ